MKYLYGDSVPSPIHYNFLTAFETFIDAAVQSVKLDQEIASIETKVESAAASREHALKVVEDFHRQAMDGIQKLQEQFADPNTAVYAKQLTEHASGIVEEARTNCKLAKEKEDKEHGGEFDRIRKEISNAIGRFLKTELLPVLGWSVTMRLVEGENRLSAVLNHPGEVITSFLLGGEQGSPWIAPIRVGSLVQGLDLQLGVRKSWITGSVARSAVSLDEFILGAFELGDDSAEIRLRKRPEQPDSFIFKINRKSEELIVELERPGEESESSGKNLDADDRARIEKLCQMLRHSVKSALTQRSRLLAVRIGGENLFEKKRITPFLEQVVGAIAPVVQEVIDRSPNPNELSMKVESNEGRREEIYVRRESLIAKIETLDDQGRSLFAPLGLLPEPLTSADVDVDV